MITKWLMFGLVCVYSYLDFYHTKVILSIGGSEGNPLLAALIRLTGTVDSVFYFKLLFLALLAFCLLAQERRYDKN